MQSAIRRRGCEASIDHGSLLYSQFYHTRAWEIAERGPMKLFLAAIHFHRARLFFREAAYP